MNRNLRSAILGLAAAATVLVPLTANADPYHRRDRFMEQRAPQRDFRGSHPRRHIQRRRPVARDDGDLGAAVALGIIGLAVGAMIVSSANESDADLPRRYAPADRIGNDRSNQGYYPPAPSRNPDVVYADRGASLEPWSDAWYRACDKRFHTFDGRTGTYMGFDHQRHFCVID